LFRSGVGSRKIANKAIADVVEALIGVALLSGGFRLAYNFLRFLGYEQLRDISTLGANSNGGDSDMPEQDDANLSAMWHDMNLEGVEDKLFSGYRFTQRRYLVEAFTHMSATGLSDRPRVTRSYQRLEFLGDSVLDFIVAWHLYHTCPRANPSALTDLRSAIVSNQSLSRFCLRMGIYKHISRFSHELIKAIARDKEWWDAEEDTSSGEALNGRSDYDHDFFEAGGGDCEGDSVKGKMDDESKERQLPDSAPQQHLSMEQTTKRRRLSNFDEASSSTALSSNRQEQDQGFEAPGSNGLASASSLNIAFVSVPAASDGTSDIATGELVLGGAESFSGDAQSDNIMRWLSLRTLVTKPIIKLNHNHEYCKVLGDVVEVRYTSINYDS
jgi:dsRNA-specific ribonuclease